jgi:hypothetical protein
MHRSQSVAFKRQVAEEFLGGETLHGLAKRHDLCRNLIRVWAAKYEAGGFDEGASAADLIQAYEARIAAVEVAQLPCQVTSPRSPRMHTLVLPATHGVRQIGHGSSPLRLTRARPCLSPPAVTPCALARSLIFLEVVNWLTPLAEEFVVAWKEYDRWLVAQAECDGDGHGDGAVDGGESGCRGVLRGI